MICSLCRYDSYDSYCEYMHQQLHKVLLGQQQLGDIAARMSLFQLCLQHWVAARKNHGLNGAFYKKYCPELKGGCCCGLAVIVQCHCARSLPVLIE